MNTLKKLAPHAAILIGNMYYVFWGIDRVNKAMNFIDNGYTKVLLALLIGFCAVNALTLFADIMAKLGRTANPAPLFVRLGLLAVNAVLAAVVLVLLIVDLFNEDLMLFLSEFVKVLILLLSITGLLNALQITTRDRARIRAMNRRAAQHRPAPQPRPAQGGYNRPAPQPAGYSRQPSGYSERQSSYSRQPSGYSERQSSYSRQPSGYSERQSSYSRSSAGYTGRTAPQPRSRYENRR